MGPRNATRWQRQESAGGNRGRGRLLGVSGGVGWAHRGFRDGKAAHVAGNAAAVRPGTRGLMNCLYPPRARRLARRLPAGQHHGAYGADRGKMPLQTWCAERPWGIFAMIFTKFALILDYACLAAVLRDPFRRTRCACPFLPA